MKQRIDVSQLLQLTPEQQEKLREWWKPDRLDIVYWHKESREDTLSMCHWQGASKEDLLPLLSIGQMIELLQDSPNTEYSDQFTEPRWRVFKGGMWYEFPVALDWDGLCDQLWQAVKEIL